MIARVSEFPTPSTASFSCPSISQRALGNGNGPQNGTTARSMMTTTAEVRRRKGNVPRDGRTDVRALRLSASFFRQSERTGVSHERKAACHTSRSRDSREPELHKETAKSGYDVCARRNGNA